MGLAMKDPALGVRKTAQTGSRPLNFDPIAEKKLRLGLLVNGDRKKALVAIRGGNLLEQERS